MHLAITREFHIVEDYLSGGNREDIKDKFKLRSRIENFLAKLKKSSLSTAVREILYLLLRIHCYGRNKIQPLLTVPNKIYTPVATSCF